VRLVIGTALWKRHALEELTLRRLLRLNTTTTHEVIVVAVGSEGGASREIAERSSAHYIEHPNSPLGAKFNRLSRAALELDADLFVVVGSDDWLTDTALDGYVKSYNGNDAVVGFRDCYFTSVLDGRTFYWRGYAKNTWRYREPIGAGRIFTRAHLRALDGELWEPKLQHGLDASTARKLAQRKIPLEARYQRGVQLVAFKSDVNLWPFAKFATNKNKRVATKLVLEAFAEDERMELGRRFPALLKGRPL
jgi:hypothetical protein